MPGRMLSRVLIAVVLLALLAVVPICVWQRQRAVGEIGAVSERFVRAASTLDLMALRDCLTDEGRASMPVFYTCVAAGKLSKLNRDVRVSVRLEVIEVKISGGEATARIRREVTERGARFGKPVNTRITDQCTVFCAYDGERWLVDLDRTLKDARFPIADISLFKECLIK